MLDRIEKSIKRVVAQRELERKRREDQQRQWKEEKRQRQLAASYDTWLDALESLRQRWRQHADLAALIDEFQTRHDCHGEGSRDQLDMFTTWARALYRSKTYSKLLTCCFVAEIKWRSGIC